MTFDFFRDAQPEAVLWGKAALTVGFVGFAGSSIGILLHVRDQRSLKRARQQPQAYRAPKHGPLERSLGDFFADPINVAPLSPDAASAYVASRLDAQHELTQSIIRYFSYAPLLLGLMGTIFALRQLLVESGQTLQEIQPHLSGVFAGTLAGVAASLAVAFGGLLLDRAALGTANKAQTFIHRFILPLLPERRIAVRIEEAVLAIIAERAHVVAEAFRQSLLPVATQLEGVAQSSGSAAEMASTAFSEAARAVRESGGLESASRSFKASAHMIDNSAEQLHDATRQTAEILLRAGEIRGSLATLVDGISDASRDLASVAERTRAELAEELTRLNAHLQTVESASAQVALAVNGLTAAISSEAERSGAELHALRDSVQSIGVGLETITELGRRSTSAVDALHSRVPEAASIVAEAVGARLGNHLKEVAAQNDRIVSRLEETLGAHFPALTSRPEPNNQGLTQPDRINLSRAIEGLARELSRANATNQAVAEHLARLSRDSHPRKRFWQRLLRTA